MAIPSLNRYRQEILKFSSRPSGGYSNSGASEACLSRPPLCLPSNSPMMDEAAAGPDCLSAHLRTPYLNSLRRRPLPVKMPITAGISEDFGLTGDIHQKEADAGILHSRGTSLDVPGISESGRPPVVHHVYAETQFIFRPYADSPPSSMPTYQSPLRHHHRNASNHREVKVCLRPQPCTEILN